MPTHAHLLAVEIAEHCKESLEDKASFERHEHNGVTHDHMLWMADQIHENSEEWPATKLHRWVGFMQGVMVMAGMTTIDKESETVREIKRAFIEEMDLELKDHQDPESQFELELGGES